MEKLNKKQEGVYVIEEEKDVANGIWEGYLDHDNVNHETIYIYTGPKLTGEKVENYFISTPSEMPWKTHLKVFSNSEKIYITYESQGDQVEAEDINLLQDSLVEEIDRAISEENRIDKKLDDEIVRAITEDEKLSEEVEELKEKKADKVYVDTELNKKYNKDEVFNKQEVLQKIQDLIGAAPEALDTLEELARALDNDPNFATNIINLLSTKVDKVAGKGLSTEDYTTEEKQKLAGIEDGANKYIHPSTHPASIIVESTDRRFVSDAEKDRWNAKETPAGAQQKADKAEQNAKAYTDVHEQKAAPHSGHETPTGAQAKVDAHANRTDNPHSVTKSQVGLGNVENYEVATQKDAEEGTATNKYMTPQRTKQAIDSLQAVKSVAGKTGIVTLSKSDVGLSNVDNVQQASKAEFDSHNQDFTRHITEEERAAWNAKETPAGAQAKADIAEQNAKAYADIVANTAGTNAKNYADNKIDDLAGAGRTTETVKRNADALNSHLVDGTAHSKTARFVVGTSTSGWTEKDCDYLCDGTNDTTIINSAIQALPATGGEIILLDGIYTVKYPDQTKITLKSNVLLRGNGVGTIIQPSLNYQYAQNLIQVSGNNVSICNLTIKPNGTHSSALRSIETSVGIRGLRIQYCYLELPIGLKQGSDFLITDNKFEACSLSLDGDVTLSKICGNSFFSAKYNGLSLRSLASSIVAGNLIQDFGEARSGILLGYGTGDYGGNIVVNNIIRQTTEGSSIGINIDGSGSKKNLIIGNHIVGVKTGIRDVGSDNVIEYNIIN